MIELDIPVTNNNLLDFEELGMKVNYNLAHFPNI